jgi:hypothetical protein
MDWFPAITTTGILAAALWLSRNVIITRLKASVQHEFDTKLAGIQSDLRKSEEGLRAELRAKERQIEALQELRRSLQGIESDKATVEQAAAILREVERVQEKTALAAQQIEGRG